MPDIVNLNRFRKAKDRLKAEQKAEENRAAFGVPKSQRLSDEKLAQNEKAFLDNHKLDHSTHASPAAKSAHQDQPASNSSAARVIKRSMAIAGHHTSISLEEIFWKNLKIIASSQNISVAGLVAQIDTARNGENLSSAIRVFILKSLISASQPTD